MRAIVKDVVDMHFYKICNFVNKNSYLIEIAFQVEIIVTMNN